MCDGVYQLVFLSPEALLSNETWRDTVPNPVYQENLVAVVIDEFYQHSCHVTLGSNVTNYIPLWNENLAHVTRRIFPSLPPPPFSRACAPRGKIRMACETTPIDAEFPLHVQFLNSSLFPVSFLDRLEKKPTAPPHPAEFFTCTSWHQLSHATIRILPRAHARGKGGGHAHTLSNVHN